MALIVRLRALDARRLGAAHERVADGAYVHVTSRRDRLEFARAATNIGGTRPFSPAITAFAE